VTAATVTDIANHWILDVVAGWAIVLAAVALTRARAAAQQPDASQGCPVPSQQIEP